MNKRLGGHTAVSVFFVLAGLDESSDTKTPNLSQKVNYMVTCEVVNLVLKTLPAFQTWEKDDALLPFVLLLVEVLIRCTKMFFLQILQSRMQSLF